MKKMLVLLLLMFPTLALAQGALQATVPVVSERNITAFDCSGTITTGGTAQLLLPITGATPTKSPNVRGFLIMNVDVTAENLCISFTGTAGAATCATTSYFGLQPATASLGGGSFASPLGFGPANNPTVTAATTGHRFTCTYWQTMKLKIKLTVAFLLLLPLSAAAQFNNCKAGFCNTGDGGGAPPVTPCDQTGLDFTLNCNMILIPALIHQELKLC